MAEDTKTTEENGVSGMRKHFDKIFASTTVMIIALCLSFYYSTKDTLANHTEQISTANANIKIIKENMDDIQSLRQLMIEYKKNQEQIIIDFRDFKKQYDSNTNKMYDKLIEVSRR